MPYILYTLPEADKDFDRLPKPIRRRVLAAFEKLKADPYRIGSRKLVGRAEHRYRVGDYRILFLIDEETREIDVTEIKHRKEIY